MQRLLSSLYERVKDLPERGYLVGKLAKESGMVWDLAPRGTLEAVRALASGAQNPSLVYRLHGANVPDRLAVVQREVAWTFRELDERIDRVAKGLVRRGLGRRKSVLLMLKNRPEMVLLSAACARIGAPAVAISWRSKPDEVVYLANHSGARALVTEEELYPVVEEASKGFTHEPLLDALFVVGEASGRAKSFDDLYERAGRFQPVRGSEDDAAVVVYTSGTTGKPKGAVRKFPKAAMPAAVRFLLETPLRATDVHLVACPMYHSTAYGFMTFAHITGATAVLLDEFKPETFLAAVDRHRVTTTAVVPTMLHRVLALPRDVRDRYDARSLRVVFSGGAPLAASLATEFMDTFGDVLYNFYGATETGLVTLAKPSDMRAAPGTIGPAIPGNTIRLLDDDGRDVKRGEVGELFVKNDLLVAGYHDDGEATKKSMRDGFFSVGDLARRDANGRYFIEGRKRDMVISGGVNVYPVEIEGVLESHPDVAEAAVVGVPDAEWGERVRAYVVLLEGRENPGEAGIKAFLKDRLAGPKLPREIVFLEALPRNPTGKVLKRELVKS